MFFRNSPNEPGALTPSPPRALKSTSQLWHPDVLPLSTAIRRNLLFSRRWVVAVSPRCGLCGHEFPPCPPAAVARPSTAPAVVFLPQKNARNTKNGPDRGLAAPRASRWGSAQPGSVSFALFAFLCGQTLWLRLGVRNQVSTPFSPQTTRTTRKKNRCRTGPDFPTENLPVPICVHRRRLRARILVPLGLTPRRQGKSHQPALGSRCFSPFAAYSM